MTHTYSRMAVGKYLEERFGFTFTNDPRPNVVAAQDALYSHAQTVQMQRSRMPITINKLIEDYKTLLGALATGGPVDVAPVSKRERIDPLQQARELFDAEQTLEDWVKIVDEIQKEQ